MKRKWLNEMVEKIRSSWDASCWASPENYRSDGARACDHVRGGLVANGVYDLIGLLIEEVDRLRELQSLDDKQGR